MFWALGFILVGAGVLIAMYWSNSFSTGAWITGVVLLVFAAAGKVIAPAGRSYVRRTPA